MTFRLSVLGVSVSLFATSTLGFFTSPVAAQVRNSAEQPKVATVKSMVDGDLMCYVTLVDGNGVTYREVGATFEICENKNTFLNKKVNLVYGKVSVNDCQSAEPCGKTRQQTLIVKMTVADPNQSNSCFRGASAGYTIPRLKVGMTGHSVALVNLQVRKQPGIESQSVGSLAPRSNFKVLQGPQCVGNYVWWNVNTGRVQGWVAEGDPVTLKYWLAPNSTRR
jgi:hypothetical protein